MHTDFRRKTQRIVKLFIFQQGQQEVYFRHHQRLPLTRDLLGKKCVPFTKQLQLQPLSIKQPFY